MTSTTSGCVKRTFKQKANAEPYKGMKRTLKNRKKGRVAGGERVMGECTRGSRVRQGSGYVWAMKEHWDFILGVMRLH